MRSRDRLLMRLMWWYGAYRRCRSCLAQSVTSAVNFTSITTSTKAKPSSSFVRASNHGNVLLPLNLSSSLPCGCTPCTTASCYTHSLDCYSDPLACILFCLSVFVTQAATVFRGVLSNHASVMSYHDVSICVYILTLNLMTTHLKVLHSVIRRLELYDIIVCDKPK